MHQAYLTHMPTKIYTGSKGGKYVIKRGKKVYIENRPGYKKGVSRQRLARVRRRANVMHGHGGYWQDFKGWSSKNLKPFESGLGGIGGAMFGDSGRDVGSKIGSWLGKITGLGDYRVAKNSLMGMITGGTNAGGVPRVQNKGNGKVTVNHREYIQDISSSAAFSSTEFKINPADRATFPWCSDIAVCFEEWVPSGIIVAFESHSADALNSTNTALGALMFASQYNSSAASFVSQLEMLNTEYMTSTKPSCSVLHPIECDPKENPQGIYYCRNPGRPDGIDGKLFYDLCRVTVATVGSQAIANIGKLFISYEIQFLKPVLNGTASGKQAPFNHYALTGAALATPLGNVAPTIFHEGIEDVTFAVATNAISIAKKPGKNYVIELRYVGTSAACIMAVPVATLDMAAANLFVNQTVPYFPGAVATTAQFCFAFAVAMGVATGTGTLTYSAVNVIPTALTNAELFIYEFNDTATLEDEVEQELKPYELQLRAFIDHPSNKGLSMEDKLVLYDRLYPEEDDDEKKETSVDEGYIKPELAAVDMTASQLLSLAVKKASK